MSLNLLLEEYLATMREEGELDALLPLLAGAMGHESVSKPQRGVRQSGVDIVTVGKDVEDGVRKVFLWLVKCGDIDRAAWSSGNQAVRQSLEEIPDVFVKANLSPSHKRLPKKVMVTTNGDFKQEILQQVSGYLSDFEGRHGIGTALVNGSQLASWAGQFLLNEYVLGAERRSLMRRALANVETPEQSINHARELINASFKALSQLDSGTRARTRKALALMRGVALFNAVLLAWAKQAGNLESAYLSAEFTLLAGWSHLHGGEWIQRQDVQAIYARYIAHYLLVADQYHAKMAPYYRVESAFAYALREHTLVVERVFEEIGRLGAAACVLHTLAQAYGDTFAREAAGRFCDHLCSLLTTHTISGSPSYDNQTVDVSCAMAALMMNGRLDEARTWLSALVGRLLPAKQLERYAPLSTDSFDDLVAIRYEHLPMSDELTNVSTLLPALALWCHSLGAESEYAWLVQKVVPLFHHTTLNIWFCGADFEAVLMDPDKLEANGFTEAVRLPNTMSDLASVLQPPQHGIPALEEQQAVKFGMPWLGLLAARHWHLQIPHDLVYRLCKDTV
ncbi:hypothetical protein RSP822_17135 [Ralstonia solanacearum]|uniref:hypothetical protein n=1 Tax=Ralstonia solanacearum TaxID=305 RepID=UPI000E66C12F|nr:hypothetical protein [Ralstonia solanacearum]RIJ85162.1 hypothetical protein RSP822_17135 [Ralstonia solanacearum]